MLVTGWGTEQSQTQRRTVSRNVSAESTMLALVLTATALTQVFGVRSIPNVEHPNRTIHMRAHVGVGVDGCASAPAGVAATTRVRADAAVVGSSAVTNTW